MRGSANVKVAIIVDERALLVAQPLPGNGEDEQPGGRHLSEQIGEEAVAAEGVLVPVGVGDGGRHMKRLVVGSHRSP